MRVTQRFTFHTKLSLRDNRYLLRLLLILTLIIKRVFMEFIYFNIFRAIHPRDNFYYYYLINSRGNILIADVISVTWTIASTCKKIV